MASACEGHVSSDRSSCSSDLCCHWLDLRLSLSVQWSVETTLLSDCVCAAPDSAPEIRESCRRIGGAALPFRLFLLT